MFLGGVLKKRLKHVSREKNRFGASLPQTTISVRF